jgi:hypothetical protein
MKILTIGMFALVMFTAFGCSETTPEGSKATASAEKTAQPTRTVNKPVFEEPIAGDADNKPAVEEPIGGDEDKKPVVEKPIAGEADTTFSLSVPFESVALTQGEEKSMLIGINRGENFREEVTIEVSDLPTGVTLVTTDPSITHGSTDATLKFKVASDAALGDFTVMVTGHTASSGADFTKEFKMTVAEK